MRTPVWKQDLIMETINKTFTLGDSDSFLHKSIQNSKLNNGAYFHEKRPKVTIIINTAKGVDRVYCTKLLAYF